MARRVYDLKAHASLDSAVIVIRGDNITVDFNGAELRGSRPDADPDQGIGVAIRIDGGHNVQVRNATARGYRVGLMAIGSRNLTLTGNDFSYNWKPRLLSLVEHESLTDWMSYHHNEKREWLRFGAGIYLDGVTGGELRNNRVEQGSSGLMLTRSDSLRIHDNTFSYNSALGVALYRSSDNVIANNRIDFNVRGYSHGVFRRGQDSAGLLIYEQSSHNIVAWNSVTHGGDGLFLWAGQATMDSGAGGANDNVFVGNDFSFAPTNGMEATFSRNDFVGNRIEGSDHGLWGGYSYDSRVIGNCFARNRIGIAIEHGQANLIRSNQFDGDSTGISLWANSIEPSDWGYPKHRDTQSRDYGITQNRFNTPKEALKILNTTAVDSSANIRGAATVPCTPQAILSRADEVRLNGVKREIPPAPHARDDRSAIVVDEWGPFDWQSPKLWPIDSTRSSPLRLRVIGPAGSWKVTSAPGVSELSKRAGRVGDTISVIPSTPGDWRIALAYRGAPQRAPLAFAYGRFEPRTDWRVRFFRWADTTARTITPASMGALTRGVHLLERRESRLDYMWYRPVIAGVPQSRFAIEATTAVTLPNGTYTLRSISDDAIRVWVDGALVIDNWTPHESAVDNVALTGGRHDIRVQYAQVDGWSELRVEILRGKQASSGTPGPH